MKFTSKDLIIHPSVYSHFDLIQQFQIVLSAFAEVSRLILWWYNISSSYLIIILPQKATENKNPNPTSKETGNPKWNTFFKAQAVPRSDGCHTWKRSHFCKEMHCFVHSSFEVLEGSLTGASDGVPSDEAYLLLLTGVLLAPPFLAAAWKGVWALCASTGLHLTLAAAVSQDKQATSIPVAQPHPCKGICCVFLYNRRLHHGWFWWLNHSSWHKNKCASLSETPQSFSS